MRRITSFVARRVDKADAPSTTSSNDTDAVRAPQDATKRKVRTFDSLSRKLAPPLRSHVAVSNSAYSSSSASSGYGEPRTPDEETLPRTRSQRGSWRSWLGAKKHRNEGELDAGGSPPPFATTAITLRSPPRFNDTDDTSSELEDDAMPSITQARDNMKAIILNSYVDPHSYSPLLDVPGSPLFPRSCLHSSRVHRRDTLASKMQKSALLRKLDSLTPAEERSIAPLGARVAIWVKEAPVHEPDIDAWPKAGFLQSYSKGLSNWVDRPCFEERVVVWTPQELSGQIVSTDVAGSQLGVAALEFPEHIHILAGWQANELEPTAEPEAVEAAEHMGATGVAMGPDVTVAVDYKEMTIPKQEQIKDTLAPRTKKGVRFAEDDEKDDQIPLGYILRIKKKREEKAKFLLKEREKRESEEIMRAREQERQLRLREAEERQQEKERNALELERKRDEEERQRERNALELEKKRAEEERRRHSYAIELQASRARRDASRAGHVSSSSSLLRDMERDRSASRDTRPTPSRTIDTANLSPYDGSPASSMPATPQDSQRSFSRPPSVYSSHTTSSEDARTRDGRHISRRNTLTFDPSKQSPLPMPNHRASLLPYNQWSNLQVLPIMVPQVSPVPVVPMMMSMPSYPMDVPLIPPSPPFMMNQFGYRQRPPNFPQSQFSSFQHTSASTHSTEGTHRTSRTVSDSLAPFPTHQRRASDDTRGHSNRPDRKYGSQTDLQSKRPLQVAHTPRTSNLHHSHRPPTFPHSHTSPGRPISTSQSRPTSNRRQTMYS